MGGTLTVDSAPGCGTRVTVSVPLLLPAQEPVAQAEAAPSSDVPRIAASDGRSRVLVADDHEFLRQGVVRLLTKQRTLVVVGEAANGRDAVSLARLLRPDVIIMDVRMPVMGGAEATRLILSELPGVIVIGLSAFVDDGFRTEMLDAGAVDLLDKAEAGVRLPARIAECLAGRSTVSGPAVKAR